MLPPDPDRDRDAIRREMRAARAALSVRQVADAAQALVERIRELPGYAAATSLAGYLAMPGEMDPGPAMHQALDDGKSCYVPVIAGQRLRFAPWSPDSLLRRNCFGILEPAVETEQLLLPAALELVLVPLVAFDVYCNRIGMGGGYYDRSFADRVGGGAQILAGVAHEIQKVNVLEMQSWDVALDCIITDSRTYWPAAAMQT
ncbi:MAG: 5-formyltetrahydrofolate cyclo-ligase [Gammaproteobacteria bacterium]|nr:5-formyltetrahydrofolate cyclo-ligase [Gammaproteobacteria bacterium]